MRMCKKNYKSFGAGFSVVRLEKINFCLKTKLAKFFLCFITLIIGCKCLGRSEPIITVLNCLYVLILFIKKNSVSQSKSNKIIRNDF